MYNSSLSDEERVVYIGCLNKTAYGNTVDSMDRVMALLPKNCTGLHDIYTQAYVALEKCMEVVTKLRSPSPLLNMIVVDDRYTLVAYSLYVDLLGEMVMERTAYVQGCCFLLCHGGVRQAREARDNELSMEARRRLRQTSCSRRRSSSVRAGPELMLAAVERTVAADLVRKEELALAAAERAAAADLAHTAGFALTTADPRRLRSFTPVEELTGGGGGSETELAGGDCARRQRRRP
ncbi:hypothetical protein ACP4OV_018446 [Aristida adscensionis]